MDKIPAHAAVNEAVEVTKRFVRGGAAKLANAVLRRASDLVAERVDDGGYDPARDRLPWRDGHIRLSAPLLPPVRDTNFHLGVATSHPRQLVHAWTEHFGKSDATALFLHSLRNPPVIVHAPDLAPDNLPGDVVDHLEPHDSPSYFVWRGDGAALRKFLADHPDRWVQDPASSVPVSSTAALTPSLILDLCAGMGTKTRQLAALHPHARIIATDINEKRFNHLRELFDGHPRVTVIPFADAHQHDGQIDMLLIDAPCSNTGTLARRPEARYRYQDKSLHSVINLQRSVIDDALPLLKRDGDRLNGTLVYSTCSIEPAENELQASRAAQRLNGAVVEQNTIRPGGDADTSYHDGAYYAVIRATQD